LKHSELRLLLGILEDVHFVTAIFTGVDVVYFMLPPFNYFDPNLDRMASARKFVNIHVQAIQVSG
jgi:hypothetical protein